MFMCAQYLLYGFYCLYDRVGATSDDEMCNFYLMYWVEGKEKLRVERCVSLGPPVFTWDRWLVGGGLSNIPHEAASSLV